MRSLKHLSSLLGIGVLLLPTMSWAGFNFEGYLEDSSGNAVTGSGIPVRLKVYSPGSEACLLYDETHSVTTTDGYVAVSIGSGTRNDGLSHSISAAFANHAAFSGLTCTSGTSYTPVAGAGRKLQISVNSELLGYLDMNPVPMSIGAEKLGHLTASNVMRVETSGVAQNVTPLTPAQYTEFSALIGGTSTQYMKKTSAAGAGLPVVSGSPSTPAQGSIWYDSVSNQIKFYDGTASQTLSSGGAGLAVGTAFSGDVSGTYNTLVLGNTGVAAGNYSKVTVDAKGRVTSGAQIASSDITTAIGFNPMNKAGDSMTGVLGLYSTPSDPSGGYSVSDKGRTWFDSTSNQIKYWDGSAVQTVGASGAGITSLNGLTTGAQTFSSANDNAVPYPQFNSASAIHTLKYPMASASGVTAGLISKSEYDMFNNKLDNATPFSGDVSGTAGATIVSRLRGYNISSSTPFSGSLLIYDGSQYSPMPISGDATISPSGFLNITNVSVSKGGTGTSYFNANQVIVSNGTGTALQSLSSCSVNQVVAHDASGFASCMNVGSTGAFAHGGNNFAATAVLGTNDNFPLNFMTNGTTRMSINPSGNIGVGTASPAEKVHVVGSGSNMARVLIEQQSASSPSDSSRITVKNYSGVNSGASSFPSIMLMNARGSSGGGTVTQLSDILGEISGAPFDGTSFTPTAKIAFVASQNTTSTFKGTDMAFWTTMNNSSSPIERMRLTNDGQMLVGTTAPVPNAKLFVQGPIVSDQMVTSGATANFMNGNSVVLTTVSGTSISLSGMTAGGNYTVVLDGAATNTYTFSGQCTTTKFSPPNGSTGGYAAVYKIYFGGPSAANTCYINWGTYN